MRQTFLSTAEVAKRLGVSIRTVHRLARRGELDAQKMPGESGAYVFDEAAVRAYESKEAS